MKTPTFLSKGRLALAAAIVASVGIAHAEQITPDQATKNVAVAKSFYSLINGGNSKEWRANLASDWKATPPLPMKPDQLGGYEMVIGGFRAGAPDMKVEQLEAIANDDVVAVRSRVTGTNTAPLFGNPATNHAFTFTAMDIHRIKDGKIVETWHVEDFISMSKQLAGQ